MNEFMAWTMGDLRECGRIAIENSVNPLTRIDEVRGPGIVPGARLRVSGVSDKRFVAVRTSTDRQVGFARRPDGRWVTLSKVDEVVIAVPAAEPDFAEVFWFDSHTLIEAFDAALAVRQEEGRDLSRAAPIFVALDGESGVASGLKSKARSRVTILRSELLLRRLANRAPVEGFIDRVKREFADMNGVDVSKVAVEFKIIS
jgi:hypothetical protein